MARQRSLFRRGLATIGAYARTEPLTLSISIAGATLFAAASVGFAAVLGAITDNVIVPAFEDDKRESLYLLVVVVGVALLRGIGVIARRFFAGITVFRIKARYRRELADYYLAAPLEYHRVQPTGRLLAHADNDVEVAADVINPLPFSIGAITLLVFAVARLAMIDPLFAAIGVAVLPVIAVLNTTFGRQMERPALAIRQHMAHVSSVAHESFDGVVVVKALGREDSESERFSGPAAELRDSQIDLGRVFARFEAILGALPDIAVVGLVAVGAWQASTGAVTEGDLVQAVALFGVLGMPIRVMGFFLGSLPQSTVARERVVRVLDAPLPAPVSNGDGRLPSGPLGVEVCRVVFNRRDSEVLHEVSFEVAPGEVVALVGPTASGKSTLLELIAGLDGPDSGEIRVGGVSVADAAPLEVQARVAMALQDAFLFADTVEENISVGRDVDATQAAATANADGFIGALPDGYETVVGERGVSLSGGQRQRVALARALAGRPGLLLLDDAMSAVDPTVEEAILGGLRAVDTTMLIVAHRRSTIELADRVVFLSGGEVVAMGTHDELMAIPAYAALVRAYQEEAALG